MARRQGGPHACGHACVGVLKPACTPLCPPPPTVSKDKTPKKSKKEKTPKGEKTVIVEDATAQEIVEDYKRLHVCAIAKPLASEKLTKKASSVSLFGAWNGRRRHGFNLVILMTE